MEQVRTRNLSLSLSCSLTITLSLIFFLSHSYSISPLSLSCSLSCWTQVVQTLKQCVSACMLTHTHTPTKSTHTLGRPPTMPVSPGAEEGEEKEKEDEGEEEQEAGEEVLAGLGSVVLQFNVNGSLNHQESL